MSDSLASWNLDEYLERLSSATPAPGGGAAAAVTAAQAASLLSMVLRITMKNMTEDPDGLAGLASDLEGARHRFLELGQSDGEAYSKVTEAFRLPKETNEERERRSEAVQEALKGATQPPLETMRLVGNVLERALPVLAKSKKNVVSDAAIAVLLLDSALMAAHYNIRLNLKSVKDEEFRRTVATEANSFLTKNDAQKKSLLQTIEQVLNK